MSDAANGDLVLEQLANAAQLMCLYAGCFPPSDEMAAIIPRAVGGPMALAETGAAWKAGAAALQEIASQLREQTGGLGEETWRGSDRDAFETEVSSLLAELGDSHNTAEAIGITFEVLCPVLAVWPPLTMTAGVAVAACASAFYIAAASGIGDLIGASEAAYATGLSVSEAMLAVISAGSAVVIAALAAAQAVLAGAVFADIETQKGHGNTQIVGDFGQAEVDGLGQVAVNAAQFAFTKAADRTADGSEGEGAAGEGETASGSGEGEGASGDGGGEDGPGSGAGDGESGENGDDSGRPGAFEGLERGEGRWGRVGRHAAADGADSASKQAADRTHAGKGLQELINDMSGWSGTQ